jgi:predicted transcriptional regulator
VAIDHTARRSSEERLAVARHALAELVTEQNEAQSALDKATEALHAEARGVLAEEAEAIVRKIADLEA